MRSIPFAFTCQYWHFAVRYFCLALCGAVFVPVLLYWSISHTGFSAFRDSETGWYLQWTSFILIIIYACAMRLQDLRFFEWHYRWPIPARDLVFWAMANSMFATVAIYIITALLLDGLFDVGWSLAGPSVFVAVVAAWSQVLGWLLKKSPVMLIFAFLVALAIVGYCGVRPYGINSLETPWVPPHRWHELTWPLFIWSSILIGGAYVVGVFGVAVTRRGETFGGSAIQEWLANLLNRRLHADRSFSTPKYALLWSEFRQRGYAVPVVAFLATLAVAVWSWNDTEVAVELFFGFTLVGVLNAFFLGFVVGHTNQSFELGNYRSTQPVSDHLIASAILRSGTAGTLLAWSIWLGGIAVIVLRFAARGEADALLEGLRSERFFGLAQTWELVVLPFGIVLCSVGLVGLGASLGMCRQSLVSQVGYGGLAFVFVGFIILRFLLPEAARGPFADGLRVFAGGACLAGTMIAFVFSVRGEIVDGRNVWACAALWLLFCIVALAIGRPLIQSSTSWGVLIIGLSSLLVAPVSTLPLAVRWNRHR